MRLTHEMRRRMTGATRGDFLFFLRRVVATVHPGALYKHNWHLAAIAEYLAACARGEITRLVINLPPRMLKSTLVSVAWPAWLMGQKPTSRLLVASYAQSLAVKHSTDCRLVMQSPWYRASFPLTELSPDQNEKDKFTTTARGFRFAVSVGGAALGEGGDILIADDPINPLQAMHAAQRDAVNGWFDHTFATRLDDKAKGAIVVVMQRLHTQDLSGYLLEKGGWEHLCLPAIAPERTIVSLGNFSHTREAGEPLHEARENLALLERAKRELGSANFNAQYQQAPLQRSGALIRPEWFPRFADTTASHGCIQSWDTAIKAGDQHDASACATFVEQGGVHRLVDMLAVRLEYPALKRAIVAQAERFGPAAVLIEDKASGQSLLQDLRAETALPLIACKANEDKLTRLVRVTPLMEAGRLALPVHAPWLAAFEAEFFAFPDGPHDDQADAVSQYLNWVRARARGPNPMLRRL
ncbi:MAG: phage terminase large subunit [Alphaproteobacteria bacterium]